MKNNYKKEKRWFLYTFLVTASILVLIFNGCSGQKRSGNKDQSETYDGRISIFGLKFGEEPVLKSPNRRTRMVPAVRAEHTPERIMTYLETTVEAKHSSSPQKPDLDVKYISRTPRYNRYHLDYPHTKYGPPIPRLHPGTENLQRLPRPGERVKYTAHIMNKGLSGIRGFRYRWSIDGKKVKEGSLPGLKPGEEKAVEIARPWSQKNQKIEFLVEPWGQVEEICKKNNSLSIGSRDLTLSIWVEKGLYDMINQVKNRMGSYSFEDWIQDQIAEMNDRFEKAKYPASPRGILDRVRIDKMVIAEDLDGPQSPMNSDPQLYEIDGRWQFKDNDAGNNRGHKGAWRDYVSRFGQKIDNGLIHELAHQLGVIDLYRMNLINDRERFPNNGVRVKGKDGKIVPITRIPTAAWNQVLFKYPGIMAGGDTRPYKNGEYFSDHTAAGLNTNRGYRRGYYGEYLYDTPRLNYLRILDTSGKPAAGAFVEMFQKDPDTEVIDNQPEITGKTDANGILFLPNCPVEGVTTATGHTLRPNPFGQICVVGTNGTMLVRITRGGKIDYSWFFITNLNLAYWKGQKEKAVHTLHIGN